MREVKMAVTDKHIATLHAQLAGRAEEHNRLWEELTPEEVGYEYSALIAAAVFEAIGRRFTRNGDTASDHEVIEFVADLRSRTVDAAQNLDPTVAERLILNSLGRGEIDDIDQKVFFSAQIIVLAGLVADEQFDETELDSFITAAKTIADDWISRDG